MPFPTFRVTKGDHKLKIHIPKSWKEEWKLWSASETAKWLKEDEKGIPHFKSVKIKPMPRGEILEKMGLVLGGAVPILAYGGITSIARTGAGPGPTIYPAAVMGMLAGRGLEKFIERHEGGYGEFKKKVGKLERKAERKIGKYIEVD